MASETKIRQSNGTFEVVLTDGTVVDFYDFISDRRVHEGSITIDDNETDEMQLSELPLTHQSYEIALKIVNESGVESNRIIILQNNGDEFVAHRWMTVGHNYEHINFSYNESQSLALNHIVIDAVGTGSGDTVTISYRAKKTF